MSNASKRRGQVFPRRRTHFKKFLLLGLLIVFTALGYSYLYDTYDEPIKYDSASKTVTNSTQESPPLESAVDPLLKSITEDCPKDIKHVQITKYPPPNPHPSPLNMHSNYPNSSKYIPLIGETTVVSQFDFEFGSFVGSPSVLKLLDGFWIASFDVKVVTNSTSSSAWQTQIWASRDEGKSWSYRTSIPGITWGSLFTVKNNVYILGVGYYNKRIMISKMITVEQWTKPAFIVSKFKFVHTGNVGVLVTEDKVQTCFKNGRTLDVYIAYAFHNNTLNLLKPWKVSNIAFERMRKPNPVHALFGLDGTLAEEGVLVPYGPKHAQVIMRVNNDEICGLSERYLWNLETNQLSFLKLSVDPGFAAGHGFVIYDPVSDFYWMVSNYPRDTRRDLSDTSIYIPLTGRCALDRSILGLYYNKHLSESWHLAGFVSYSPDFAHHASYPFLVQDGDDLVFVARAHLGGPYNETTVNHGKRVCAPFAFENADATANNHNSNMVIFNRITNFRKYIHPMMWYGQRIDNPWVTNPNYGKNGTG